MVAKEEGLNSKKNISLWKDTSVSRKKPKHQKLTWDSFEPKVLPRTLVT